jgi:hypothetical protein
MKEEHALDARQQPVPIEITPLQMGDLVGQNPTQFTAAVLLGHLKRKNNGGGSHAGQQWGLDSAPQKERRLYSHLSTQVGAEIGQTRVI